MTKLNYDINGVEQRILAINALLDDNPNPGTTDLNRMTDYILWAQQYEHPEEGQLVESKSSPWQKGQAVSLDALQEQERETGLPLNKLISKVGQAQKKAKLDRKEVQEKITSRFAAKKEENDAANDVVGSAATGSEASLEGSPSLRGRTSSAPLASVSRGRDWLDLWRKIDETEFKVQTWELGHGKRRADLPIRESLHLRLMGHAIQGDNCLSDTLICDGMASLDNAELLPYAAALSQYEECLAAEASNWDATICLRNKRNLVELRKEQYNLLDNLAGEMLQCHVNKGMYWDDIQGQIEDFLPFSAAYLRIDEVREEHFNAGFQQKCVTALKHSDEVRTKVDLREPDTIRGLLNDYKGYLDFIRGASPEEGEIIKEMILWLIYYIKRCGFSEELTLILRSKIRHCSNKEIAESLKENYGIIYQENYISTIYSNRIIKAIAEEAQLHYRLIEFITMGKTVFKKCSKCGKLLPRNTDYFNKRSSTSDGFYGYCKDCKKGGK